MHKGKVTHASRGVAARKLADMGVSYEEIRRSISLFLNILVGRWNSDVMVTSYINHLPWQGIKSIAGFPSDSKNITLPRANLDPPEGLMKRVFPQLDLVINRLEGSYSLLKKPEVGYPCLATEGHLKLLKYLRKVFFQDSVALQRIYPDFSLFRHSIFQDLSFLRFQESLKAHLTSNISTDLDLPSSNVFENSGQISTAIIDSHNFNKYVSFI